MTGADGKYLLATIKLLDSCLGIQQNIDPAHRNLIETQVRLIRQDVNDRILPAYAEKVKCDLADEALTREMMELRLE